ncbi:ParB N-terminal domain-containing protein [Sphingobacterium thalpophilum]|uniref:hypothetical protein n=1 Tax=Sphingobacterium thalpophilum TaxID=259 RepID=UPI002D79A07B|nr:hypothetical protein [Sphingobacterium thalpophilum]
MSNIDEIDDFDSIEAGGLSNNNIEFSNVYNVKIGGFGDPNGLKTYLGSLKVEDLENDVDFYETLSKDKSWPVSQIIQREVDKIRVSNISKDYVLGAGRMVKYFPPIIVAILPKTTDGRIELNLDFGNDNSEKTKELIFEKSNYRINSKLKDLFIKSTNKSLIHGLYLLEVSKVFEFNVLCWDKSKYFAIVIDGQHRMDALIKSKNENLLVKDYLQDVVFLEFSNLVQLSTDSIAPIEVVRRVFVDINTNAKRVGLVRQILMDDKDLASIIVQSLVDSVDKFGKTKESDYYLPSELVDWYGESLKHRLPHFTGILSLYQIVNDFLLQYNISSINDRRSPNKVKNWVSRINDYFLIDRKISEDSRYSDIEKLSKSLEKFNNKRSISEEINDDIDDEFKETVLFNYDYRILEIAKESFNSLYAKGIVRFFSEFVPYKAVYQIVSDMGGFNRDSILNKVLLSSNNAIGKSQSLQDKLGEIRSLLDEQLTKKYFLIHTVLGQKAFFNILFKRIFKSFNKDFTEEKCIAIVDEFISDVNEIVNININDKWIFGKKESLFIDGLEPSLLDLGKLAYYFWEGIIFDDNKIVYNSQGIQTLSSIIEYMLLVVEKIKTKNSIDNLSFEISYMRPRISRILSKTFELSETEKAFYTDSIMKVKQQFLNNFLVGGLKAEENL